MARLPKLLWLTGLSVVLASAVLPGCGDDDGSDEPGEETGGMAGATGGKGGATTGGKGGATGGKGGATTGGSTQGGEAGAPVGTGGAPVGTGGSGGAGGADIGGAGAGGAPVVGGAGAGGGDVGGAGAGGGDVGGAGGAGEGGAGGSDEVTGGTGGTDDGVGGEGGEGGTGPALLSCTSDTASSTTPAFTGGVGKDCAEFCADFFDECDAYLAAENPYDNEGECEAACAALGEADLCCVAAHAVAAGEEGPGAHCEKSASAGDCYTAP